MADRVIEYLFVTAISLCLLAFIAAMACIVAISLEAGIAADTMFKAAGISGMSGSVIGIVAILTAMRYGP